MAVYFTWGAIGVLVIALVAGFLVGLLRGLKRSSLHLIFLVVSVVVAFFITKPITNAVLGISVNYEGTSMPISEVIVTMVSETFDLSSLEAATSFVARLPMAILGPMLFLVLTILCYFIFDIIYLIVARVSFGKKKKDFEKHKPYRAYGALIGMVEGFLLLFVMFAPITALTKTYGEIVGEAATAQVRILEEDTQTSTKKMKTLGEMISESLPKGVTDAIIAYNNCVVGKIAGAGGLDNAIFDGLASFEVADEKINFRKEVVTLANVYDEVAVTYNNVSAGDFENIDLANLKTEIETFLNNGIFKAVITDTINTFIVKFDELREVYNLDSLPQLVQDIANDLHASFTADGFDAYEYLKADILKVVDIADEIFKNNLIEAFTDAEDKSLEGILDVVSTKSDGVKEVAKNFFKLNIVRDAFSSVGKFASEKLSAALENEKGLEIALNVEIENKEQMIEDVIAVVTKVDSLLSKIDLFKILSAEDPISVLTNVENVKTTLEEVGVVLDDIRELEILTLPAKDGVRAQKVYVLDNIFELYNVKLLGDEIVEDAYDQNSNETLDTYEKFFTFIGEPIGLAKDLGLFEIETKGFEKTLEEKILPALREDEEKNLLAKILTPFYQLKKASFDVTNTEAPNLRSMIFDLFIKAIGDNVSILDVDGVKEEVENEETALAGSGIRVWHNELTAIGKTLDLLNNGEIAVEGATGTENKTYLKYILMQNADMFNLLKEMLADDDDTLFANVLNELFNAAVFGNLKTTVFNEIDKKIGQITNVVPQTDLTNLEATKAQTIQTIEGLLEIITDESTVMSELNLQTVGKILDLLKVNAYNGGSKNGVFNNIFANLVWYMTGDSINGVDYTGETPYENTAGDKAYEDVKAYLSVVNNDEYYTINYAEKFAELQDVIAFADKLMTAIEGKSLDTPEDTALYLAAAKGVIDEQISTTSRQSTLEVIENTTNFLTNKDEDLLEDEDLQTRYTVKAGIEEVYGDDAEMATALKKLMGVNDLPDVTA